MTGLKDDQNLFKEAKREWRRKHFILWLLGVLFWVPILALAMTAGYFGGAGLPNPNNSGKHSFGGVWMENGSWDVYLDNDDIPDYGIFSARRDYLECSYSRFAGPVIRRYWIGDEITSNRELSRLEGLEFDRYSKNWFGEVFRIYDKEVYERASVGPSANLDRGCPNALDDENMILPTH